jgi:hypothetical protein
MLLGLLLCTVASMVAGEAQGMMAFERSHLCLYFPIFFTVGTSGTIFNCFNMFLPQRC